MKTQLFPLNRDGKIAISILAVIKIAIGDLKISEEEVTRLIKVWADSQAFQKKLNGGVLSFEGNTVNILYPGDMTPNVAVIRASNFNNFLGQWIDYKYHQYKEVEADIKLLC